MSVISRYEPMEFTNDELVQYRAMLQYAEGGLDSPYRHRTSLSFAGATDPHLYPIKYTDRRSPFVDMDEDGCETASTALTDSPGRAARRLRARRRGPRGQRGQGARSAGSPLAEGFVLRQGRVRRFLRAFLARLAGRNPRSPDGTIKPAQ